MFVNQEKQPQVLWNVSEPFYEGDCACSSNQYPTASSQPVFYGLDTLWQKSSFLYTQPIHHDYDLFFHAQGLVGPVVLNHIARKLLDTFAEPRSIRARFPTIAGVRNTEEVLAVQHMIHTGLLSSPGSQITMKQSPKMLTAWIHVTNDCNLRCDYCYIAKTPDKMELEKGKQAVDAIFRSTLANGFKALKIKFAGGESTLNFPLILELYDYAKILAMKASIDMKGVVLSNGVGISNPMIDELQQRGLGLSVSLDGVGDYHNAQRRFINGKGSFNLVERSLDRLSSRDVKLSITITVSNRNLGGLAHVVDFVLQRKLPFTINFYRENECSSSYTDLAYDDDKIIESMRNAFSIIENHLPEYSLLGSLVDRARLDVPHNKPCGVGDSYLVIDEKGKVAKCHMEIERSITDVTASDPLKLIRLDQVGIHNPPVEEKEGCRECTWRYWCAGGCPALTYRITGRYDVKSPNCHVYQALFPDVLRLEGLRLIKYGNKLASHV